MECEKRGMLAVSMAGHDRGKVYVVWSENRRHGAPDRRGPYTACKAKEKKQKAYTDNQKNQETWQLSQNQQVTDEQIKYMLKCYRKEREAAKEK